MENNDQIKALFTKNHLIIILCFYFIVVGISFTISNYFIIWGESNSIKYPFYNLSNLIKNLNFEQSLFTNVTDLPKGYHGGLVSSLITFSLLSFGKLLLIDPFIFSFFFSSIFIFLAINNFYYFFNKKINFKLLILLTLVVIFSSQHFLYLFSGSMPNVYNSIFIYITSLTMLRINNCTSENFFNRLIFIFLFVFAFYAGAANYLIFFFLTLFVHFFSYFYNKNFFKFKLLIDYFLVFILCLPYFIDVFLHPFPPLGFNKVNVFSYLSAGFINPGLFSKYVFPLYFIIIYFIWAPVIKFTLNKRIKLLFYWFFIFGLIISSTKLLHYLNIYFPSFNVLSVRSGWRWTLLPLLIFIFYYCYIIEKKNIFIKILIFITFFNFISFILVLDQRITLNKIPNDYLKIREKNFFSSSNVISLPASKKYDNIFMNYDFFKNPKQNHAYPSSLFGFILPLKNYIDLDLSDHISKKKYKIINSLYFQKNTNKLLLDHCIKKIIIEKKKRSINYDIKNINDYYSLVSENDNFKILDAKDSFLERDCKQESNKSKFSYINYYKKLMLDGQFLRANRKNPAFRVIYDERDIFLIAKEKIYNYEFYAGVNYKKDWCVNIPYPAKLSFYFKDRDFKNLKNFKKVEFLDILNQGKKKIIYFKKDVEILNKMQYCLKYKPTQDFVFYIDKK